MSIPPAAAQFQPCEFRHDGHRFIAQVERGDPQDENLACDEIVNVFRLWTRGDFTGIWFCQSAHGQAVEAGQVAACFEPDSAETNEEITSIFRIRLNEPTPRFCQRLRTRGYDAQSVLATLIRCGIARSIASRFFVRCQGRRICTLSGFHCYPRHIVDASWTAFCVRGNSVIDLSYDVALPRPPNVSLRGCGVQNYLRVRAKGLSCSAARGVVKNYWRAHGENEPGDRVGLGRFTCVHLRYYTPPRAAFTCFYRHQRVTAYWMPEST